MPICLEGIARDALARREWEARRRDEKRDDDDDARDARD